MTANPSSSPNIILVNGNVITMDPGRPAAGAIAISNGVIAAVGTDAEAREAGGPGATVIDLGGRTATPGLNDAHSHPMLVGFAQDDLDVSAGQAPSITAIAGMVREAASTRPPGTWIIGRGYDDATLGEQRHPTRADLDAVSPDHPVLLWRMCHHIAAANSRALELAGVTSKTDDASDGVIDRNEHGEPTGVLRESAIGFVTRAIGDPTTAQLAGAIERAGHQFLRSGVTSYRGGRDRPSGGTLGISRTPRDLPPTDPHLPDDDAR